MGTNVFANNHEICSQGCGGKSVAAMPDVCFTPPDKVPPTPPGVPVPYPNTGMASDLDKGSKKVSIKKKPASLRDQSLLKKSIGNEAGAAQKKGVVTSTNQGKVYFTSWSMDVKIEAANVNRNSDMMTHNHGSMPANSPPQVFLALQAAYKISDCEEAVSEVLQKCDPWDEKYKCPEGAIQNVKSAENEYSVLNDTLKATMSAAKAKATPEYQAARKKINDAYTVYTSELNKSECNRAMRCILMPYKDMNKVKCDKQTPEHLIEDSSVQGIANYQHGNAPCAFTEGPSWHLGDHGVLSAAREDLYKDWRAQNPGKTYDTEAAAGIGASAHQDANSPSNCNEECTKQQLIEGQKKMGVNPDTPLQEGKQTGISDAAERARRQEIMQLRNQQSIDLAGLG